MVVLLHEHVVELLLFFVDVNYLVQLFEHVFDDETYFLFFSLNHGHWSKDICLFELKFQVAFALAEFFFLCFLINDQCFDWSFLPDPDQVLGVLDKFERWVLLHLFLRLMWLLLNSPSLRFFDLYRRLFLLLETVRVKFIQEKHTEQRCERKRTSVDVFESWCRLSCHRERFWWRGF